MSAGGPAMQHVILITGVADRVRAELLRRIGLEDLLAPQVSSRA